MHACMHDVSSSIWHAIKKFITIHENSTWKVGDNSTIKFWCEKWLSKSIANYLDIPHNIQASLQASIS